MLFVALSAALAAAPPTLTYAIDLQALKSRRVDMTLMLPSAHPAADFRVRKKLLGDQAATGGFEGLEVDGPRARARLKLRTSSSQISERLAGPWLTRDTLSFLAATALPHPQDLRDDVVELVLRFENVPKGWRAFTSLGEAKKVAKATREVRARGVLDDLLLAFVHVEKKPKLCTRGPRGWTVVRDKRFALSCKQLGKKLKKLQTGLKKFGFVDDERLVIAGRTTGRVDELPAIGVGVPGGVMLLEARGNKERDITLAHEMLHTWIGPTLLPAGTDTLEADWFLEGFTEYASVVVLERAKLLRGAALNAHREKLLRHYFLNSSRRMSNTEAAQDLFANPEATALLYSRGAVLAMLADHHLRAQGSSLAAWLVELSAGDARYTPAELKGKVRSIAPVGARLVAALNGEVVDPGERLFDRCLNYSEEEVIPRDYHRDETNQVSWVRAGSPAARAGLKVGTTVTEDDTARERVRVELEDGREITWRPVIDTARLYRLDRCP